MKILIIGGNGNIGYHCTIEALKLGHDVWVISRGDNTNHFEHRDLQKDAFLHSDFLHRLYSDIRNIPLIRQILNDTGFNEYNKFDVIVDFLCYKPEHTYTDIELFNKMTNHFIFISSTAVYKRPYKEIFANESSQLDYNTTWGYAYNKIQCEEIFKDAYKNIGFPITIIRPAYTYDTTIPYAVGHDKGWTICQRMIDGRPIILLGDGISLWSLSHSNDISKAIVSLFGNHNSIGQIFHITSNEYLTWIEISEIIRLAISDILDIDIPSLSTVYVPTNYILRNKLDVGIHLYHHRRWNDLYDNSKIKSVIPNWKPEISFKDGIKETIKWFNEDIRRKWINAELDKFLDDTCKKFSML
jgi:nucleoside-diphosphate-sugar epimerase